MPHNVRPRKSWRLLVAFATLALGCRIAPAAGVTNIMTGSREVIYTAAQRNTLGLNYWPDGNLGVIPDGSGAYYFYAANGSVSKRTRGPLTAPAQTGTADCSMTGGETFNYKAGGPIYKDPASGRLLQFYHAEVHPGGDATKFYSVLGMGISEGSWTAFYDCGRTVQANMTQAQADSRTQVVEMAGSPYIVKDGYFYVYYRDTLTNGSSVNLCVARAPVTNVVAAATNHSSVAWQKYYSGAFSEPGLGGRSSSLESGNPTVRWMDIKWNSYLRKYVMVLAGAGSYPDLYMMFSDDGLNWSARTQLESEAGESFYPSLVGTNSANPQELGRSFYVYYTYSVAGGWDRWSDAQVARRLITIDDGSPTNTIPRILLIGDSNTEIGYIHAGLRDAAAADYGAGGSGYLPCNEDRLGQLPSGFFIDNDANWQKYDMYATSRLTPPHPAPDGNWAECTNVGATTTIRFTGTAMDLYWRAESGGGTFSISMDGVSVTNIAATNSFKACRARRGNAMTAGPHTAVVAVVSGRVSLLGVDARSETNGPLWRAATHKWGNGCASTFDYLNIETNVFRTALQELSPNIVAILLGTNDHNIDGRSEADFKANLIALVTRITNAIPGVKVMLVSTFETDTAAAHTLLPQYVATSYPEAAAATGAEYWDMSTWFGAYNAARMIDAYHVNSSYGAQIGQEMYNQIKSRILNSAAPTSSVPTDITVANFSFERPDVANGTYSDQVVSNWNGIGSGGSRYGVQDPSSSPSGLDGSQYGWMNYTAASKGGLYQNPGGHTIQANQLYTLTTAVGYFSVSSFRISLRANANNGTNGTILASTTLTAGYGSSFTDVVISFNSANFPGNVGQSLYIVYEVLTGTVDWQGVSIDNVRLSYVSPVPLVSNSGATNIAPTHACFNGSLTSTGGAPTTVWLYWGTMDGGTSKAGWGNSNYFGVVPASTLSSNIVTLSPETTYWYRYYATNAYGDCWANPSWVCTTPSAGSTPLTGYDAWAASIMNGLTNATDCAAGDGYPNLLKYATGSSPTNSDGLARTGTVMSNGVCWLTFNRNTNASDVTFIVEAATNLTASAWLCIATNFHNGGWQPADLVDEAGIGVTNPVSVSVKDDSGLPTRFMRIVVTRP